MTDRPGGTFDLAPDLTVGRVGYGAMQLAGPGVFGPPRDRDAAIAVLRETVALGINHIDTSDYYGPYVTNELIREALAPYPDDLCIVTKVGARRDDSGAWLTALGRDDLRSAIHDNLRNLGLERLDVVNLRLEGGGDSTVPQGDSLAEPFETLAELQQEGLIRHLGLSTATAAHVAEAQQIAPVVCVQNFYNLANRRDDHFIDALAEAGIGYTPYFPLGGFSSEQTDEVKDVAEQLGTTANSVALAWLLQRSPNMLLIPGTSSVEHLRANVAAVTTPLPAEVITRLNSLGQ